MEIKELRKLTGLSQTDFGKHFGIPMRTIQNWEGGSRECPAYVKELLERAVKEDFTMEKNGEIEIMMSTGMTKRDAERHLKDGVSIYVVDEYLEDFDENMKELIEDEVSQVEELRKMMQEKREGAILDGNLTKYNGEYYWIEYCL